MKQIDGGIGGGQVLRLAISLAALDGTPVEITNVRGARDDPGLRPQHVAAVKAVAAVSAAEYDGVEIGSETVTFEPGDTIGGEASVDVDTAGSISLIFDAILPLVLTAEEPIVLHASGGTDVKWSPPIDYLRRVKLPFLERFGLDAAVRNVERGFYPRGGGSATLSVEPGMLEPITCPTRGDLEEITIQSIATADLADAEVVDRQVEGVKQTLEGDVNVPITDQGETVESVSTGTSLLVVGTYEHSRAGFSALGEPGWPAEEVGEAAAQTFLEFHNASGAVDRYLADQLLPFLALHGGTITTPTITDHIRAAASLLERFGRGIEIHQSDNRIRIVGRKTD